MPHSPHPRRPLFLDRDGVLNRERTPYITHAHQIELLPGVVDALEALHRAGFDFYVVSNQQGVAKGFIPEEELPKMSEVIQSALRPRGFEIRKFYYATAHASDSHPWRKPAPGMILAARDEFGLDLAGVFLVGDRWSDIEAGAAAGLRPLLVLTGLTAPGEWEGWKVPPEAVLEDLPSVARYVLAVS